MRKRLILIIVAVSFAVTGELYAQNFKTKIETVVQETEYGKTETTTTIDKYKVETNYFLDNCFVTFGIGTQLYMGDNEKHMHIKDLLTPAIDFSIGKWFSPELGLAISYSGYKMKGLWNEKYAGQYFKTNKAYPNPVNYKGGKYRLFEQKTSFYNLHIDALINLSNIFCGYNENRIYNFIPYIGVGWIQSYNNNDNRKEGDISFNAGIINRFRLSDALDLNITLRGALVDDDFDGEVSGRAYRGVASLEPENFEAGTQNFALDGYGGITIGLTYKFKTRGWNKARTTKETYINEKEIARLKEELSALRNQNESLKNTPPTVYVKKEVVTFPYLVNFTIDKAEVVNREKVNLKTIAGMIKSTPKQRYLICGYADKTTGSKERNRWLAEHRAQNVYDVLTEEFGVSPEQLVTDSKGGIDNLYYDDPQVSRSVVISEIK